MRSSSRKMYNICTYEAKTIYVIHPFIYEELEESAFVHFTRTWFRRIKSVRLNAHPFFTCACVVLCCAMLVSILLAPLFILCFPFYELHCNMNVMAVLPFVVRHENIESLCIAYRHTNIHGCAVICCCWMRKLWVHNGDMILCTPKQQRQSHIIIVLGRISVLTFVLCMTGGACIHAPTAHKSIDAERNYTDELQATKRKNRSEWMQTSERTNESALKRMNVRKRWLNNDFPIQYNVII